MNDEVHPPSKEQSDWLEQAEAHILHLLRHNYGNVALNHSEADLQLAQRLIDEKEVGPSDTLELQCLGVMLGNVFATNTSMQWAEVSNEFGTMLAIHSEQIGFTLYPLTMISKRVEEGRDLDLLGLYRTFVNDLRLSAN
jgi:hypothetical protein